MITDTHNVPPAILPRSDLRYSLWAAAAVALLPVVLLALMHAAGEDAMGLLSITADLHLWQLTLAAAYGVLVCALATVAGWLCPLHESSGRGLAVCAAILSLPIFPLGTILGLAILVKLKRPGRVP